MHITSKEHSELLNALNGVQSLYEDICKTLEEKYLPYHEKFKKIKEQNEQIGKICSDHLPG